MIISTARLLAQDSSSEYVIRPVTKRYHVVNPLKKILLGSHYRKEWSTPVKIKILHIDTIFGGLTPLKEGGSRQTTNLRLENGAGQQYVIRSVDKTPTRALPEDLRKTMIGDIMQDQESSENPYGPLVIPPLAKAAGVFYTSPRLVFIPYDSSFKKFAPTFADMVAYIEERPHDDMSAFTGSGNSKNVISTDKMFELKYKNPQNTIDDNLYARTRLFDMLIGDWGRHEDQWRWATFEKDSVRFIKPIPRDRDHVFYKSDGILPFIASRKWAMRVNQNFGHHYRDITGLNLSASYIDRALLAEVTREEFQQIASSLQSALTDDIIDNAVHQMPPEIYAIHGKEITEKLKSRRDDLPKAAAKYYKMLSKDVDVTGTEKDEVYKISRINKRLTEVTVTRKGNADDTLYHRVFDKRDTREIRVYGIDGNDEFIIPEKNEKRPLVRVVKEKGYVKSGDSAKSSGLFNQYTYNAGNLGNELMGNTQIILMRSPKEVESNRGYDRSDYHYNFTSIVPSYQFNMDDKLFIGLGMMRKTFGFRKYPYGSYHTLNLSYATGTSAVYLRYFGDYKKVFGEWNAVLNLTTFGSKYVLNYFGLGNETVQKDTAISYYRVKAGEFLVNTLLYRNITRNTILGFGPQYQFVSIDKTPERFISTPEAGVDSSAFGRNQYIGGKIFTRIATIDNIIFPRNGVRWNAQATYYHSLTDKHGFINTYSDFSVFYTPKRIPGLTFATRVGGGTNFGGFQFFQANTLGGTTNLRGYRRTRYYGRTTFFHNTEARIKLFNVNLYLFPGKVGLILFYDYGRVWQDNEDSHIWHVAYGPGIYLQIYNRMVLTGTYGLGAQNQYLNIQFGFLF
ncbi:MAG: hypothetical protein ACJ75J_00615 [Cytophagaceae bacterium]